MPKGIFKRKPFSLGHCKAISDGKKYSPKKQGPKCIEYNYKPYFCDCGCWEICKHGKRFAEGGHAQRLKRRELSSLKKTWWESRSSEERKDISKHMSELSNPWSKGLTKDTDIRLKKTSEKCSRISTEWWASKTDEEMKLISERRKEYCRSPLGQSNLQNAGIISATKVKQGKGGHYYSKKNDKTVRYDSSFELSAFDILEQMTVVKFYERCPYVIDYEFEGKRRKYIPDILITYNDGNQEIIEIKSEYYMGKDAEIISAKMGALQMHCLEKGIKCNIWTEKELFN